MGKTKPPIHTNLMTGNSKRPSRSLSASRVECDRVYATLFDDVEANPTEPGAGHTSDNQASLVAGQSSKQIAQKEKRLSSAQQVFDKKPEPTSQAKLAAPWVNLFKDNRNIEKGIKLEKHQESEIVEYHEEDADDTLEAWGICLIGYILGKYMGAKAIVEVCDSWHVPYKYFHHSSGWIVFRFEKEEHMEMVLANGPYSSYGKPWVLKRMPTFFRFNEDGFTKIPTWITLPSFPLELWNAKGLGRLVSRIGEPIATDMLTAKKSHPSYARVLVEVDATKPLVRTVPYKLPNGELANQVIHYEYEPILCSTCKKVGHDQERCHMNGKFALVETSKHGGHAKNARGRSRSKAHRQQAKEQHGNVTTVRSNTVAHSLHPNAPKTLVVPSEVKPTTIEGEKDLDEGGTREEPPMVEENAKDNGMAKEKSKGKEVMEEKDGKEQSGKGEMVKASFHASSIGSQDREPVPEEATEEDNDSLASFMEDLASEEEKELHAKITRRKTKKKGKKNTKHLKGKGVRPHPHL